jgi:hypothetical protein
MVVHPPCAMLSIGYIFVNGLSFMSSCYILPMPHRVQDLKTGLIQFFFLSTKDTIN